MAGDPDLYYNEKKDLGRSSSWIMWLTGAILLVSGNTQDGGGSSPSQFIFGQTLCTTTRRADVRSFDFLHPSMRIIQLSDVVLSLGPINPAFPDGPPLAQVDADLIFIQTINYERKRNPELRVGAAPSRHLLFGKTWKRALCELAVKFFGKEEGSFAGAFGAFASHVLQPLTTMLDFQSAVDVSNYAVEMGKQKMVECFSKFLCGKNGGLAVKSGGGEQGGVRGDTVQVLSLLLFRFFPHSHNQCSSFPPFPPQH